MPPLCSFSGSKIHRDPCLKCVQWKLINSCECILLMTVQSSTRFITNFRLWHTMKTATMMMRTVATTRSLLCLLLKEFNLVLLALKWTYCSSQHFPIIDLFGCFFTKIPTKSYFFVIYLLYECEDQIGGVVDVFDIWKIHFSMALEKI